MINRYLSALWVVVFLLLLVNLAEYESNSVEALQMEEAVLPVETKKNQVYFGSDGYLTGRFSQEEKQALIRVFNLQEKEIYTFLQGPRSWGEGREWSGEWCMFGVKGNSFGNFGCGLCCMANIYNTLSPYEVSPWDMCEYAMQVSGYAPTRKSGAIDWGNMKEALKTCGFTCDVYYKPNSYETFQEQMAQMKSAVVLISSNEDDTYWKNTPGHYVNIWMYQEEDDTVFLAEPGSPENNRSRIPLRYVYDALKTTSKFQYLAVEDYREEKNQWKADGIGENWNPPVK